MLKLKDNWRAILLGAWSNRFWFAATLLTGAEVAFPYMQTWLGLPDQTFGIASGVLAVCGIVARHLDQGDPTLG